MKALYAGSFDPITLGHIDLIRRLAHLYNPLVVLAANSHWKNYLFSIEERTQMIQESLKGISSVEVDFSKGLVVDYAKKKNIKIFIRGVRVFADFEYELAMAQNHKEVFPECETLIALTQTQYAHCSSKIVKEIAFHGGKISHLVPKNVEQALIKKQGVK